MAESSEPTLCIVGAGRVGSVLAHHFLKAHYSITGIIEKNKERHLDLKNYFPHTTIQVAPTAELISQCRNIIISVQDDQLSEVVSQLERLADALSGKTIAHTSGAYSSDVLIPLKKRNALIASAHPIYSFGSSDPAKISLKDVYVDIEGDGEAVSELKILFQRIEMNTIEISAGQKLAIHIASVLYSNYFVGLAQIAQEVLGASKIPKESYWEPFLPLVESTLDNLSSATPADALTGPIKRGDIQTVREHVRHLKTNLPEGLPVYVALARFVLNRTSLSEEKKSRLEKVLDQNPS